MARPRRTLDLAQAAAALTDGVGRPRSMTDVAATLGVAKPTLFKLARSRAELEAACAEAEAERLLGRLEAMPSADWRQIRPAGGLPFTLIEHLAGALEDLALPVLRAQPAVLRRVEVRLAGQLRLPAEGIAADDAAVALLGAAMALAGRRRLRGAAAGGCEREMPSLGREAAT